MRKQLSAYENDDSEESKRRIQELKLELESAENDLAETEMDRLIENTQKITDDLYNQYSEVLNTRLDNIDLLLENVIAGINSGTTSTTEALSALLGSDGVLAKALGIEGDISKAVVNNADVVKATIGTESKAVGVTLSTAMNSIWSTGEGNAKSILTMYGEDFKGKSTTINTTLNGIKASVDKMANKSDKEAAKKTGANKTSTSAKKDPTKDTKPAKPSKPSGSTSSGTSSGGDGKVKIGDKVKYVSGQYYYDSYGRRPLGSHKKGDYVYITNINKKGTHPYHISRTNKLGQHDLGWLKLNQISGYAAGKKNIDEDEVAWTQEKGQEYIIRPSDGAILTPVAKGDSVLNATASGNIWNMANNPAEFIKNNLGLDASNVPNGGNVQSNLTQHFENITFSMPNVKNYNELLSELKDDPKFNKLILAMTLDQVTGKSKLAKGKAIR